MVNLQNPVTKFLGVTYTLNSLQVYLIEGPMYFYNTILNRYWHNKHLLILVMIEDSILTKLSQDKIFLFIHMEREKC